MLFRDSCLRRLPLVLLASTHPARAAWWPFPQQRFTGNSLLSAGSLGLDGDIRVIAFGDFNGDQYLDVLTLDADAHTLAVHLWDHDAFVYRRAAQFKHPSRVQNAVPGDFTQDGRLDLLVMSDGGTDQISMSLYIAESKGGLNMHPLSVPSSTGVQPMMMDVNGDMKIDLLGLAPGSPSTFKIWQNVYNSSQPQSPPFYVTDAHFNGASCKLANPHSNAVIDLDGDCLADLFLVCDDGNSNNKHFQIWLNNKESGFALAEIGRFPAGAESITFADIDRDGTMDLVFPTCDGISASTGVGTNCFINIVFNQQLPICESATKPSVVSGRRVCRPVDELCLRDSGFKIDFSTRSSNHAYVRFPLSDLLPGSLVVQDPTFSIGGSPLHVPIRLGDADVDGFPEMLLTVYSTDSHNAGRTSPVLVSNVPCTSADIAGCGGKVDTTRRGWQVLQLGTQVLSGVSDARSAAFIDIDEDGTLDIMVQRTGADGKGNVLFVQNNFYHDAFFLKAIVLNSPCDGGLCRAPNGSTYHPYGTSYSGGTFKYSLLDAVGKRAAAQIAQLPQTGYHALHAPYAFFGLGRTNNYIAQLFVGATTHARAHYAALEGVVPNSRLVAIPPAGGAGADDGWRTELFLRPGAWSHWVGATVAGVLALLAAIVAGLHVAEKKADERERRQLSHQINFDAL